MSYGAQIDKWLKEMAFYLVESWGLEGNFANQIALFYLYCAQYGLNPKISSGFRSPEKQKELMSRYVSGDKSIVVKPAETSMHSNTGFLGKAAALAIDVTTNNRDLAARIATQLNIGAGLYFKTPDSVHFYSKKGA